MQMKQVFRILAVCALSLGLWTPAYAIGPYKGLIMPFWKNNVLYMFVGAPVLNSGVTGCQNLSRNLVRLSETDPNDPVFKAKYAMLLASWTAQRPVTLIGRGICTVDGDELIYEVYPLM